MIAIRDLEFHYRSGDFSLRIPSLDVADGESVALIGSSGTGKTTLLNLVAACEVPHQGTVTVCGRCVSTLPDEARREFRISNLGLVFQEFELLSHLSVLDNILLPYRLSPALELDSSVRARAERLAEEVGIADKLKRRVDCLSQGERQRVAVCRCLLPEPTLLLCDEPTGNLDPDNTRRVLDMILDYAARTQATVVSATHEHDLLPRFSRTVDIEDLHFLHPARTNADE